MASSQISSALCSPSQSVREYRLTGSNGISFFCRRCGHLGENGWSGGAQSCIGRGHISTVFKPHGWRAGSAR